MNVVGIILASIAITAVLAVIVLYAMGYLFTLLIQAFVKGWARFFNVDR